MSELCPLWKGTQWGWDSVGRWALQPDCPGSSLSLSFFAWKAEIKYTLGPWVAETERQVWQAILPLLLVAG